MKITAAAAAALALTALAACSSSHDAAKHPAPATRVEAVVPAGMESFRVNQTILHVNVPGATAEKNARNASAISDAAVKTATVPPAISTAGQIDNVIVEHESDSDSAEHAAGEAVQTQRVTSITISLGSAKDQAPVTKAVQHAVKGAKITVDHEEALGLHLTVPVPAGANPNLDAARKIIDPILLGGYNLEQSPREITIDYIGSGVTPAGLATVKKALADSVRIPAESVQAQVAS